MTREWRDLNSRMRGVTLFISFAMAIAVGAAFPASALGEDGLAVDGLDDTPRAMPASEFDDQRPQPVSDVSTVDVALGDQSEIGAGLEQVVADDVSQETLIDSVSEGAGVQAVPGESEEEGDAAEDSDQPKEDQPQEEYPTLPSNQFSLESGLSYAMVADANGGSHANGANIQLYHSNGTAAQRWALEAHGQAYYIVNPASGKVLDVAGGRATVGTNVQLYQKNGTNAQLWLLIATGNGGYVLRSMLGGSLVLDVSGGKRTNGTNLQVWVHNGTAAQSFWFREVNPPMESGRYLHEDGAYILTSAKSSEMALDVANGNTSNGANIQVYSSNGTNAQRFYASYADGYYTFQSCASGLALGVASSCPIAGTNVQLYTPNHTAAQQWKLEANEDGLVLLTNRGTGLVLDISGGKTISGTNVQGYYANGTLVQLWKLTRANIIADGCYTILDSASGKALDVSNGSLADGALLQRYATNGAFAQKFYLTNAGTGFDRYTVRSVNSSKAISGSGDAVIQSSDASEWTIVLTDRGLMLSDGSRFLGFDGNGKACLTTEAKASSVRMSVTQFIQEGYYQLRLTSNQALDVSGQSTSPADVVLAASGDLLTQVWRLVCVSGNTYKLINIKSGLYLAVNSANRASQMQGAEATSKWTVSWDACNGGIVITNVASGEELSFAEADGLVKADAKGNVTVHRGRWLLVNKWLPAMPDRIAQVAEHFASHDAHGYSQPNRGAGGTEVIRLKGGTSVTISKADVDCSEMACQCVNAVLGYNAIKYMDTRCEDRLLKAMGLVRMVYSADSVQRGDILWRQGHTAIALGGSKQAEAFYDENHSIYGPRRGDNNGAEVAVNPLRTSGYWTYIYRYV